MYLKMVMSVMLLLLDPGIFHNLGAKDLLHLIVRVQVPHLDRQERPESRMGPGGIR